MSIGDPNSLMARTRYRIRRLLRRISRIIRLLPVPAPAIDAKTLLASDTVGQPDTFVEDDFGSGPFGHWIVDDAGLPAYRYEMNQYEDDRATYPVSHGAFRRDHWHQIGNDHLNALASNDGTVQVFVAERGFLFLNHFDYGAAISLPGVFWSLLKIALRSGLTVLKNIGQPYVEPTLYARLRSAVKSLGAHRSYDQQFAYAGGFAYIDDGHEVWSTAYRYSPKLRPNIQRIFGMGYFQTVIDHRKIRVTRKVYAPAGDVSALLVDVELTNTGSSPVTLNYYEYWDINFQQITFQAFRSDFFAGKGDADRRSINTAFTPCIAWIEGARALRFHHEPPPRSPGLDEPDSINWHPRDVFLADLSGGDPPLPYYEKARFFGRGNAERPESIGHQGETDTPFDPRKIMPYCMVLRREVRLGPGQTVPLRFAYGTILPDPAFNAAAPGQNYHMPASWSLLFQGKYSLNHPANRPFDEMVNDWKDHLVYFTTGDAHYLQREVAWHAYYLQSSTVYSDFFANRIVPQGSFYLYGQGIDGVPRDFALFALPLIYLNPGLARDVLRSIMKLTRPESGQIAYSYTGNGLLTGALIHNEPSDLDLFFLLAMTEYLAATGDEDFLYENVSFYPADPQPADQTVLHHMQVAFEHLTQKVMIGESGLLHIRDGDWSDDVVVRNTFPVDLLSFRSFPKTVAEGESIPNSQMALYVLPRTAALLRAMSSPAAQKLGLQIHEEFSSIEQQLTTGIQGKWHATNKFYARAVLRTFRDQPYTLHENQLDLEAQVWPLINQREADAHLLADLKQSVYTLCDQPSPIGPMLASHDVWPAIAQLLTWGYTQGDSTRALQAFLNLTFANKTEVYGDSWINVWSGPDGINGPKSAEPGETYNSFPVTPTTDFPVMNNNQHAMMLLGLLRISGIEPAASGDGLRINSTVLPRYALKLPLISLDVSPERIQGEYQAHNRGRCALYVALSSRPASVQVTINGQRRAAMPDQDGYVKLALPDFDIGDRIPFEVVAR